MEEIYDPTGKITELAEAARDPAVADPADPDHAQACANLAYALGDCRLFAIDPGPDNGTLPLTAALAAAMEITTQLRALASGTRALSVTWNEEKDLDFAYELLASRRDASAALLALNESLKVNRDKEPVLTKALEDLILGPYMSALDEFDEELRANVDLLSCLAGSQELANDRAMLSRSPHGNPLPWWLDGTLERHAESLEK